MDIVARLREGDQILGAEVVRKRDHPYRANRLAEVAEGTFNRPPAIDAIPPVAPAQPGTAPAVPALNPNAPSLSPTRP
jgi:hypothetical protein